jgi:hypothetical protein
VIEREKVRQPTGALITLREPTAPMLIRQLTDRVFTSPRISLKNVPACATIPSKEPSARRKAKPANRACSAKRSGESASPSCLAVGHSEAAFWPRNLALS